jgi:hypothetical protein
MLREISYHISKPSAYCKVVKVAELQNNADIQLYMCICGPG